ncbi:MAG TPA: hypothetical protein VLJ86_09500, partial [Ramlibacter sp.]|nr:hypothetical protein [Ramlibacter sp.]
SALQLGVYVAELAAVTVGWGLHKSFKAAYNLGAEFFGAKKIEASLRPVFGVCWDRVVKSASALASIGDAITDVGPTKPPEPADLGPADFQSALAAVTDVDSPADAAVTQPDPSTLNVLPAQGAAPSDLQNLERARGQMAQAAKVAKLAAARDKVVTRALAMGALVAGGVMTSMLLTPIAPPLAFVGLIVTWYLFKNARANLKTSITNRDLLLQGKPPLEVGHGAMGNAVHQWNLKRARKANGGKEVDAKTREDLSRKAAATGIHVNRLTTAFALGITLTTAFTASLAIVAVFAIRRGVQAVGQFIPWASDLYSDRRNRKAKETPLEVLNNTLGARLQAVDFQPDKLEKELVDELALWQIPPTDIAAHATKLQTWAAGGKKGKKPMLLLPTSGTAAKLTQAWHENNLGMALNVVAQAVVYAARSA